MSKIVEITEPIDADDEHRRKDSAITWGPKNKIIVMDDRNNSFGTYLKVRMTAELGQGETETKTTRISKAAPEPL
jgi:hypothetical protein